jgi:hypothetical protein
MGVVLMVVYPHVRGAFALGITCTYAAGNVMAVKTHITIRKNARLSKLGTLLHPAAISIA